ncbi:MAG: ATP synthase F1 subunit epsilon [Bacteroidetes bacterium]|nr:ATP synthase F1 subunit epsilon [Bacteroidota bacterium]
MSKTLTVELITPEGAVYNGEATAVQVPGIQGSFQVLYNHAAIISTLGKGKVKIDGPQGAKIFMVEGGVVEVLKNHVVVLAQKVLAA